MRFGCGLGRWLFIYVFFSGHLLARSLCDETLYRLGRYSLRYSEDRERKDEDFWKAFKASEGGEIIDLSAIDFQNPIKGLGWYEQLVHEGIVHPRSPAPSHYEIALINLRAGDRVRFGDREFLVGSFLGAGNATHIYQVDDFALRLPFAAEAGAIYKASYRMEQGLYLAERFIRRAPRWERYRSVEILEYDPSYRFTRVEFVPSLVNGLEFAKNIWSKPINLWTSDEEQMFRELNAVYSEQFALSLSARRQSEREPPSSLRQWAWTGAGWILLDWE